MVTGMVLGVSLWTLYQFYQIIEFRRAQRQQEQADRDRELTHWMQELADGARVESFLREDLAHPWKP